MKKRIKLLFVTMALALGFFFTIGMVSLKVHAEELPANDTTETEEEPEDSADDEKIEVPNADAAITPATTFLERFKFFKWSDFEAVIGWIITYLAVNYATILAFVVTLLIKKTASVKQSKKFQDALAKLTLEQQEEIKSLVTNYENKLEELQNNLNDFIKTTQEEVKSYQEKLEELQADSTVAITTDLKQIAESLK